MHFIDAHLAVIAVAASALALLVHVVSAEEEIVGTHITSLLSMMRSCLVQFTRSFEEKASR